MKKFIRVISLFIFFSLLQVFCLGQAPVLSWVKGIESLNGHYGSSGQNIQTDAAGNVYTVGSFDSTIDLDPGPGSHLVTSPVTELNGQNIFISKLDPSGNFLWGKAVLSTNHEWINTVAVDSLGNVYVCGGFNGTAIFDPATGVNNLVASAQGDHFIFKMNAAGDFVWAKQFGTFNFGTFFYLAMGRSGLYITGQFAGTVDFDPGPGIYNLSSVSTPDCFIEKLDTSGNLLWVHQQINGSSVFSQTPFTIAIDNSENLYVTGIFHGTVDFDPGPGISTLTAISPGNNSYIFKVDADFNFIWARAVNETGSLTINSIGIDTAQNVFLSGLINGVVDFDPGPGAYELTPVGTSDMFISKLNSAGDFEWARQVGNDKNERSYKIVTDAAGNVYSTGVFQGTVDFDPGPGVYNMASYGTDNYEDIFIYKLNPLGNFVWAQEFGGSYVDYGFGIYVDNISNVFATGWYWYTVDFDPGPGIYNLPTALHQGAYILKLSPPTVAPLTLLDFSARLVNVHEVQLQWQTAMEQNTDKFIIERSEDSRKFSSIGTVTASINSSTIKKYFFTDKDPIKGNNYYRLKMIDKDGMFTYSKIEVVNIVKQKWLQLYPNPAQDVLYIKTSGENETATLQITDAAGKIIKKQTLKSDGNISFSINIQTVSRGKYNVMLQTNSGKIVMAFFKL